MSEFEIIQQVRREAIAKLKMNGIEANVSIYTKGKSVAPEDVMMIIEKTLGLRDGALCEMTRTPKYTEARYICSLFIRDIFPKMQLEMIARYYGFKDHTTVSYGIMKAKKYLESGDVRFTSKYNICKKAIEKWLQET